MERIGALKEFMKMWTWLCKHPAHDSKYYVRHVAKPETAWRNDCPLCALSPGGECKECGTLWDEGHGSLCSDPNSPLYKWKKTQPNDPDNRAWYAGKIVELTGKHVR